MALAAPLSLWSAEPAAAQRVFCPATVGGGAVTGIALDGGFCTDNAGTGAFSGAALATQALSDLSQSTTQQSNGQAERGIATRRTEEEQRCPEGFVRVGGECRRPAPSVAISAPPSRPSVRISAPPPQQATRRRAAVAKARRPAPPPPPVVAAVPPPPPPVIVIQPHFGVWSQVFGSYEQRSASGIASGAGLAGGPAAGPAGVVTVNLHSTTTTGGIISGFDYTARNLAAPGDGLITGILVGYASSHLRLSSRGTSAAAGTGTSSLSADLAGPSVGVYTSYFNGPFSADLTAKFDFLGLDETFSDTLAFAGNFVGKVARSGAGSTSLTNSSILGNLNYRFPMGPAFWIEPTIGFQYTATGYAANAARLGLDDGQLFRIQGGARFGFDRVLQGMLVTTTLTALAYDDVMVKGGFVPGLSAFGNATLIGRQDQGKLRGEGILAFNLDFGNGVSALVQGDIEGGEGLFAVGGRVGLRYQW